MASDGRVHGVFDAIVAYCEQRYHNLRIDTHAQNLVMQHLIVKHGFVHCGTVYVADGSARLAYQRCIN